MVDDSIVRGTTSRKIVRMLREAGASEVHVRVSSPPTMNTCHYGIDTPTRSELIASNQSVEEIQRFIEADSLGYLSVEGMGDFQPGSGPSPDAGRRFSPITATSRSQWKIGLLNRATTPLFNAAYELAQRASASTRALPLFEFLFPVARKVAYFKLFGAKGLHEYQMLVPVDSFEDLAANLRRGLARFGVPIALASCKLFKGERSLLRFDGTGICLALDFPNSSRSDRLAGFLDGLVREARGLPNIVKDSRLSRETVEACYAGCDSFRRSLREFDPLRLYRSEVSERLGL